jgi:hypothetical protein
MRRAFPRGRGQIVANKYAKETQFKTFWYHRKPSYWFRKDRERIEGFRDKPEVIRLDPAPGVTPSAKPPVRIFLGTEPAQYRPERVFVWAVMQVRDPARVYEIHLMKDLAGFDRTGWKTGFTNYRYAIPTLAGGQGRAIFNDVDQIYLSDPAELFDMEMGGAGVLCITPRETSVMLIDCAKMIQHWNIRDAQTGQKHRHFRDLIHDNKLWGQLPGEWNARDEEYSAGRSKCFHFTTLQTQPWQPFPDQLRYAPHPDGEVWFSLERGADRAGFTHFTRERPSRFYTTLEAERLRAHNSETQGLEGASPESLTAELRRIAEKSGARSVHVLGPDAAPVLGTIAATSQAWSGVPVPALTAKAYDGVAALTGLDRLPDDDVQWALDALFRAARQFVHVAVAADLAGPSSRNGALAAARPAEWWKLQLEMAARRTPGVAWSARIADAASGRTVRHSGGAAMARAA